MWTQAEPHPTRRIYLDIENKAGDVHRKDHIETQPKGCSAGQTGKPQGPRAPLMSSPWTSAVAPAPSLRFCFLHTNLGQKHDMEHFGVGEGEPGESICVF